MQPLLKNSFSTDFRGTYIDHERAQFTLVGLFPGFTIAANFSRADPGAKRRKEGLFQKQPSFSLFLVFSFSFSVSFSLSFSSSSSCSSSCYFSLSLLIVSSSSSFSYYTLNEKLEVLRVTQSTCSTPQVLQVLQVSTTGTTSLVYRQKTKF